MSLSLELPVEFNKKRVIAKVEFSNQRSSEFLAEWNACLGEDKNPLRVDAVTFARLAVHRVAAHFDIQPYAGNSWDIADHISVDKYNEVGCFVQLKCDWFPDSGVIGVSHFRRTWANNIILDYLATHPSIVRPPSDSYPYRIRGVGRALLYFVCKIAMQNNCGYLWGEATQLSNTFYEKMFELAPVADLIHAPTAKMISFVKKFDEDWKEFGAQTTVMNSSLDKINEVEVKYPPFVGSQTAVFDPPRQLAIRFLKLPSHVQLEIAGVLGLREAGDNDLNESELFRQFFTRATDQGKLSLLWSEIEKRRPDPQAGPNPFSVNSNE